MTIKNAFAIPEELYIKLIKERFEYEPLTGKVYWKKRIFNNPSARNKQWNVRYANKEAGFSNGQYLKVSIEGKSLYIHQVAFAIMLGYIPNEIEHKDKNKINNKWENLREATHAQNSQNVFKRCTNKSGYKGVSWSKSNNCWRMDIQAKGIKYHSYHSTPEEAYNEYILKSKELHGEFGYYDND